MSRYEVFAPEGLRVDGRRWNELRKLECTLNSHPNSSDGSSYVEHGGTKVVCEVRGPREPDMRSHSNQEKAYITINLTIAPFSSTERKKRMRNDKRTQEMVTVLQRLFDQAILGKLYPRTEIAISFFVLAQDGGVFAACINACTLALVDAGVPMRDYVTACTVALYDTTPLLDPCHLEESDLSSATIGIIGNNDKVSLCFLEDRVALDRFEAVLSLGVSGCHGIRDILDKAVRKSGKERLESRGS